MILALLLALAGQVGDSVGSLRRVDGLVVRGTREAQLPVADQWVVLHRVGRDRAGPLDSIRTSPQGRFRFRYRVSGDTNAIYFATTSHGGIVYPTSPFRAPEVFGDDAKIVVFDTTSTPIRIGVAGRHVIIGAPNPNGRRPIGEVYDLENDTTLTRIARDSVTPVWTTHIPPQATAFQVNASGDVSAGGVVQRGNTVAVFVPLSPGIRQFGFTYELPANAFPLTIASDEPVGVLEVLVQEPTAHVQGGGMKLRETQPVSTEGRVFRRMLAQDLQRGAVLRVDVPRVAGEVRDKVYIGVAIVVVIAMGAAGVFAARRRPRVVPVGVVAVELRSHRLVREIAALDDAFDRTASPDDAARATYTDRRAALKQQLADAIAAERGSS